LPSSTFENRVFELLRVSHARYPHVLQLFAKFESAYWTFNYHCVFLAQTKRYERSNDKSFCFPSVFNQCFIPLFCDAIFKSQIARRAVA